MTRDVLPDCCSLPSDSAREQAVDVAREDKGLQSVEKTLAITLHPDGKCFKFDVEKGSMVRGLLARPHFGIKEVRVSDDDRFGARLTWDEWLDDGGPITGVVGYLPVRFVSIGAGRSHDRLHGIVSDYDPRENGGDDP